MTGGRVVAVTGATGFLGQHIVAALARDGAQLRLLVRDDPAQLRQRGIGLDARLETVRGGLEDAPALARLVTGADAIVHAAGLIKARSDAQFLRVNRDGTAALADAARRHAPLARFILISSLAARAPGLCGYAASKCAGEAAAGAAYTAAAAQLVILRPPAIYGPGDRETLPIFKAASRGLAPLFGHGRIALIHVRDAAAAIARLAMGAGAAGCFALADTRPGGYSLRDILAQAARATGRRPPRFIPIPAGILLTAGHAAAWWGRCRGRAPMFTAGKAREMLHPDWSVTPAELLPAAVYQSAIGLDEGFAETAAWYRSAGWLR